MQDDPMLYQAQVRRPTGKDFYYMLPVQLYSGAIGIVIAIIFLLISFLAGSFFHSMLVAIIVLLICLFTLLYAGTFLGIAKKISIYSNRIEIALRFRNRIIPCEEIVEIVRLTQREMLRNTFKLTWLHISWALTDPILIKRKKGFDLIVSLDDREQFLARLKEAWGKTPDSLPWLQQVQEDRV